MSDSIRIHAQAAEIEHLRALIAEMRGALEPFAEIHEPTHQITTIKADHIIAARAARDKTTVNSSRFWQPIETAPKDGTHILVYDPTWDTYIPFIVRWFKYNGLEAFRDGDGDPFSPTHWRALPSTETARITPEKKA